MAAEYDEQSRDRIRRGLLAFMKQHGIGTPRLCDRITKSDPRRRTMALSNLQRFLAASHRTFDVYVDMCAGFLEREGAAIAPSFAEALLSFLSPVPDGGAAALPAGEFATTFIREGAFIPVDEYHANAKFLPDPSGRFATVTETVFELVESPANEFRRWPYDGVAVRSGGTIHVYLRNSLTRAPKYYSLRDAAAQQGGPRLDGEAFECPAWRGGKTHFRVSFAPPRPE